MSTRELTALPNAAELPMAAKPFLRLLARLDTGTLTFTSPEGHTSVFVGHRPGPHADIRFADWGVVREILQSADIGLAECYRDHRIASSDLAAFLELCAANARALEAVFYGRPWIALLLRIKHWLRSNTRRQARKNIHAHYDLSNDFYRLWLDRSMTYSSALFAADTTRSLEEAQRAKYERILTVLNPPAGARILEIGSGWGGFAEYAATTRGVLVHGITLSVEQLKFARTRIARAGLADRATFELIDYRDVNGTFDYVVSIEMFEAVGERYWSRYFRCLHERLTPGGRAIVQSIVIDEKAFARYRTTSDFIREYIFPGGMLAPVSRFARDAERAGLLVGQPYRFGLDYAETLRRWHDALNANAAQITSLGFDEKFLQLWRFYLCYCEAGFRAGRTDVMQIELARPAE